MSSPLYSVLLPTHNRADVLRYAIQSVLGQSVSDFELLVVGDGCTDETSAVVSSFNDGRVRWFDLPKAPGVGYANRNIALREALGEFVAFMAHDDLIAPDHLEKMLPCFAHKNIEWAYSRPVWVSPNGVIFPFCVNLLNDDELEYLKQVELYIPASCIVYRRSCHDRYGLWPEDVLRDGDRILWSRFLRSTPVRNYTFLPTPTAFHFQANWRAPNSFEVWPATANFLYYARENTWWPSVLKMETEPGRAEQYTLLSTMERGGTVWLEELRAALARVIDRVAWEHLTSVFHEQLNEAKRKAL